MRNLDARTETYASLSRIVVNSAWILYRNLMGELDEALTQLGMELDENDAMQKKSRASNELIGIMHNNFMRKQNKKRFWKLIIMHV